MAEYNLIQKYYPNDNPNQYIWAVAGTNRICPKMLYDYSTGKYAEMIYMTEDWFISVQKLNKQKLPYAAYQKINNGGIAVYVRWPNANVIMKWSSWCPSRADAQNDVNLLRTIEELGKHTFAQFKSFNHIERFYNVHDLLKYHRGKKVA